MNLIMKCVFGSHLYGLQTPTSDKDFKGIYLPTKRELLLGKAPKQYDQSTGDSKSKNKPEDIDVEIFSLANFIDLACKGETVALDMLHCKSEHLQYSGEEGYFIWHSLQCKRKLFYTKNMSSYVGYARRQANKYGIKGSRIAAVEQVIDWLKNHSSEYKSYTTIRQVYNQLPLNDFVKHSQMGDTNGINLKFYEICGKKYQDTLTLEQLGQHAYLIVNSYGDRSKQARDNEGVDFKAVSHALRAAYQCLGILKDGDFEYPLPQNDFLLKVKTGQLDFVGEIQPELERVIDEVETLCLTSSLPESVNREYWDDWLLDIYEEYL